MGTSNYDVDLSLEGRFTVDLPEAPVDPDPVPRRRHEEGRGSGPAYRPASGARCGEGGGAVRPFASCGAAGIPRSNASTSAIQSRAERPPVFRRRIRSGLRAPPVLMKTTPTVRAGDGPVTQAAQSRTAPDGRQIHSHVSTPRLRKIRKGVPKIGTRRGLKKAIEELTARNRQQARTKMLSACNSATYEAVAEYLANCARL